MQESLHPTADAGVSLLDIGCRSLSIRQRMQESLYQTADAGYTLSDRCLLEKLLHPLSDGDTPASAL